jgi:hypothetical protein
MWSLNPDLLGGCGTRGSWKADEIGVKWTSEILRYAQDDSGFWCGGKERDFGRVWHPALGGDW